VSSALGSEAESTIHLPPLTREVDRAQLLASSHIVSWNQSQLLTVHVVDGATAAYNIPMAFWLRGVLAATTLRSALYAIVDRHAVLRTMYEVGTDGSFKQRVSTTFYHGTLLREVEVSDQSAAQEIVSHDQFHSFDLLYGNAVFRGTFLCIGVTAFSYLLTFTVHHVATDLWSNAVLLRELSAFYTSFIRFPAAVIPHRRVQFQYIDFAIWQETFLRSQGPNEILRSFWRAHLREGVLPLLDLPHDYPRPTVRLFHGDAEPVLIPANVLWHSDE